MISGILCCLRAEIKSYTVKNRELRKLRKNLASTSPNDDYLSSSLSVISEKKSASRFEARALYLAYAYRRGKQYKQIEKKSIELSRFQFKKLIDLIAKYGVTSTLKVEAWINDKTYDARASLVDVLKE